MLWSHFLFLSYKWNILCIISIPEQSITFLWLSSVFPSLRLRTPLKNCCYLSCRNGMISSGLCFIAIVMWRSANGYSWLDFLAYSNHLGGRKSYEVSITLALPQLSAFSLWHISVSSNSVWMILLWKLSSVLQEASCRQARKDCLW